jgi:hypothetical protein
MCIYKFYKIYAIVGMLLAENHYVYTITIKLTITIMTGYMLMY